MSDFLLLFRQPSYDQRHLTPAELHALTRQWGEWVAGLAAQGHLVQTGTRLAPAGKVLRAGGVVTDGPFVEIREQLGSFLVVRANDLDEATTLAHGCPALEAGGSVEIRPLLPSL